VYSNVDNGVRALEVGGFIRRQCSSFEGRWYCWRCGVVAHVRNKAEGVVRVGKTTSVVIDSVD